MFRMLTNAEQFTMEGRKAAVHETNLEGVRVSLANKLGKSFITILIVNEGDIPQKEGGGLVSDKALIDSQ